MSQVILQKLHIRNLGPIKEDSLTFEAFTYLVGRNNAGKSHYLQAVELLLAPKNPSSDEISILQNDKKQEITIDGTFSGVGAFTNLVTKSNHKEAIQSAIVNDSLRVMRKLDSSDSDNCVFGVLDDNGEIQNPAGFASNLLKILPEVISIVATADTVDELKSKGNTAIVKLKKEVLANFLENLNVKAQAAFANIDEFLHSVEAAKRSPELTTFENDLKEELVGEFVDVTPSVEFELPNVDVIAQQMRIYLDDGYRSEVEQKGHGLQRATLLALLRLLAKQGKRFQDKPAPIFLIGEIETFLHPYAQRQLALALSNLVDRYQIITTTHSPFIINPKNIAGYRRVVKGQSGTKVILPNWNDIQIKEVKKHLEWRANLEGLFAERIILIEGTHDESFYELLRSLFGIEFPPKKFTLFVKAQGKKNLRLVRSFYIRMGFDDVAIISDLDYLFCNDIRYLLEELKIDPAPIVGFRKHIEWTKEGDPGLGEILSKIETNGEPAELNDALAMLSEKRVFVLKHGEPESYVKNGKGKKGSCNLVKTLDDLLEPDYLKDLIKSVVSP
jgi:putative ATP-dependent endonuclease of OLD family